MSPLLVVAAAVVLLFIGYAVFQFRRQWQEYHRRGQQSTTTVGGGPNQSHLYDKRPGGHLDERLPSLRHQSGARGR